MTIGDHRVYENYSIIYCSDFQSETEVRLIPRQVILGFNRFCNCSKKGCFLKCSQNQEEMMKLKVSKESKTGLNTEFVNIESGRKIKLEQAIQQVGKGNPGYQNYVAVKNPNGTTYLRSKPNGSLKDNIE